MIKLKQVYKSFGEHDVLKGVDLEIKSGSITVILGQSGTGKSVLLKNMIGLLEPDRGQIFVDGTDITQLDAATLNDFRRRFGMLFQNAALFDSLSVQDNIAFPLREHSDKTDAEILEVVNHNLSLVGLSGINHKQPSELSGGMRKRVGLARAIALEPKIVLYDEPTTGLDPITAESINQLIVTMQKRLGVTSVVISHDIESTFQVADHVAMLHGGSIVEGGTPEHFRRSKNEFVQHFIGHYASKTPS